MNQSLLLIIERLVKRGEILAAELIAEESGLSQKTLQAIIEKHGMEGVNRVYS